MAKGDGDAGKAVSHREEAERILDAIGGKVSAGTPTDDVAGAIIGVGHALLAIHDELHAIRVKTQPKNRPDPVPDAKSAGAMHLEALKQPR